MCVTRQAPRNRIDLCVLFRVLSLSLSAFFLLSYWFSPHHPILGTTMPFLAPYFSTTPSISRIKQIICLQFLVMCIACGLIGLLAQQADEGYQQYDITVSRRGPTAIIATERKSNPKICKQ
ncbi:hypothetical protein BCR43DRAFT_489969 [Syncephalastrum racemosum]|uniref:Uncharacterized protein n=1 Tax=Syncephalastrum racemosum TaxID=13706 RepID=A0A1X2HF58_SYNRA|nr:hypothetical protein BCR43DRAFT_489969 [Syncephalastrum racemosum]